MPLRLPAFIYFDLGNVILFFSHRLAARQMAAVAGVPEQLVWQAVFESDLEHRYEAGDLTGPEFCEAFARATNSSPDPARLLHAAADIFELNVAVVPLVMHLRRAGHRLGILSNTNEAHWRFVSDGRYAIVRDCFATKVLSYEIGAMKPEPAIYQAAAERAGVAPEEIFYTDDRPENVAGALAAGFDAVLFENARQLAADLRRRGVAWSF